MKEKEMNEYEIRNENGELFCKCRRDSDGGIRMIVKGTSITLQDLQAKALNPAFTQSCRAKKRVGTIVRGS